MRDIPLLQALLAAETEDAVIKVLEALGPLEEKNRSRWTYFPQVVEGICA
jgi:hypothetical protein